MLLQAEGIEVNKGVLTSIYVPSSPYLPLTTITITLSPFHLQAPLVVASREGRTEIVRLLLQSDGIDVNTVKVSIKISTYHYPVPLLTLLLPLTLITIGVLYL